MPVVRAIAAAWTTAVPGRSCGAVSRLHHGVYIDHKENQPISRSAAATALRQAARALQLHDGGCAHERHLRLSAPAATVLPSAASLRPPGAAAARRTSP